MRALWVTRPEPARKRKKTASRPTITNNINEILKLRLFILLTKITQIFPYWGSSFEVIGCSLCVSGIVSVEIQGFEKKKLKRQVPFWFREGTKLSQKKLT